MKIGVTGTRFGMNDAQLENVVRYLKTNFVSGAELHEGDCVGVDVQVAKIARHIGYKIVSHPPIKEEYRAFYEADEYKEQFNHLRRNRNIVDSIEHLMVVPYQDDHQTSGGTWYTYDYALKRKKPLTLFTPNGKVKEIQ